MNQSPKSKDLQLIKKIISLTLLSTVGIFAKYNYSIETIPLSVQQRMINSGSYRSGCPVAMDSLRYLKMKYIGFDGDAKTGEMIVHKDVAKEVVYIFKELYNHRYPIRQMKLVSSYQANDFASIEADNTSAFNCRSATGSKKWSRHSYGKAIDINPIENPYVSRTGHIAHKKSLVFRKRRHKNNAVILKNDPIVALFKSKGWRWGGDWKSIKDYQHFDKR